MRIYVHDLRFSKICMSGARYWWNRHGFSWKDFLQNGIEEEELLGTGDAIAQRVVEEAHGRQ